VPDAQAFIAWLTAHGAPKGTATVLDLETAVDEQYVTTFGEMLHTAGYLVLPYGSSSTLFRNPVLDGYFVAKPEPTDAIPAGSVAVQWSQGGGGAWDLDELSDSIPLWDSNPPPIPAPAPTPAPTTNEQENGKMEALDPISGGTWVVDPTDGHVETPSIAGVVAPYLGGLNNPHPDVDNWQQVGKITGITPAKINGEWGYAIIVRHNTALANGAFYSGYTFPRPA
jgi:hypothetical protein